MADACVPSQPQIPDMTKMQGDPRMLRVTRNKKGNAGMHSDARREPRARGKTRPASPSRIVPCTHITLHGHTHTCNPPSDRLGQSFLPSTPSCDMQLTGPEDVIGAASPPWSSLTSEAQPSTAQQKCKRNASSASHRSLVSGKRLGPPRG